MSIVQPKWINTVVGIRRRKPRFPHTRVLIFLSHHRIDSRTIGDDVAVARKNVATPRTGRRSSVESHLHEAGLRKRTLLPSFERHSAIKSRKYRKYGRDHDDIPRLATRRSVALSDANSTRSNQSLSPAASHSLPPPLLLILLRHRLLTRPRLFTSPHTSSSLAPPQSLVL